jgi:hypothetical protein
MRSPGLGGGHEVVASSVSRFFELRTSSTGLPVWKDMMPLSLLPSFSIAQDFLGVDLDVAGLALEAAHEGWWIMTRALGRAKRRPLAPAAEEHAPMLAAWPRQIGGHGAVQDTAWCRRWPGPR